MKNILQNTLNKMEYIGTSFIYVYKTRNKLKLNARA